MSKSKTTKVTKITKTTKNYKYTKKESTISCDSSNSSQSNNLSNLEESEIILDKNYQYVYLIHPEPLAVNNISIYKIGRTDNLEKRFYGYPKNSIIYHLVRVQSCHYVEKQIIKNFKKNLL